MHASTEVTTKPRRLQHIGNQNERKGHDSLLWECGDAEMFMGNYSINFHPARHPAIRHGIQQRVPFRRKWSGTPSQVPRGLVLTKYPPSPESQRLGCVLFLMKPGRGFSYSEKRPALLWLRVSLQHGKMALDRSTWQPAASSVAPR